MDLCVGAGKSVGGSCTLVESRGSVRAPIELSFRALLSSMKGVDCADVALLMCRSWSRLEIVNGELVVELPGVVDICVVDSRCPIVLPRAERPSIFRRTWKLWEWVGLSSAEVCRQCPALVFSRRLGIIARIGPRLAWLVTQAVGEP